MNGTNRYLLDSNALIFILGQGIVLPDVVLFYSSISKIELLSYPKLEIEDDRNIRSAFKLMQEVTLNEEVIEKTISIRKTGSLKLPDSLILASAISKGSLLVTDDKKLLNYENVISIESFLSLFA